jgi:hypothetical protein
MGSTTLCEHITAFFSRAEKPSKDMSWWLFPMNMKGLIMVEYQSTKNHHVKQNSLYKLKKLERKQ